MGGDNTIIEGQIKDIDEKLGIIDPETNSYKEGTLYFEKNRRETEKNNDSQKWNQLRKDLTDRLTKKANRDIKTNSNYIKQGTNYNVSNIQTEVDDIINNRLDNLLSNEQRSRLEKIITEKRKDSLSSLPLLKLNFLDYVSNSKDILLKKITLTSTLAELVENDLLQDWVDEGRNLHKNKETCGFCGGPITIQRCKEIDEHFSKESEELKESIEKSLNQLNLLRSQVSNYLIINNINSDRFYTVLLPKFIAVEKKWNEAIETLNSQIDILDEKLKERLQNIFKPLTEIDFSAIEENPVDLSSILGKLNVIIEENESKSKSIEQDKNTARKSLRYDAIKKFLNDIKYTSFVKMIDDARIKADSSNKCYDEIKITISELETEKKNLEKELKDESRAAEKINKHLTDFFGHDSLKLVPNETHSEGEIKTRFVIKRGENDAKNLSEGECSLIAFCYFMAKIEDELQDPNAKDNLIIYIDDPISSLDNNHIFFVFGIINTVIVFADKIENVRFNQLFISTHNLEFLKYLHRLLPFSGLYLKDNNPNMIHLLIEKRKKKDSTKSILRLMPKHLRLNTTEYIYLFKQIYNIAKPYENIDDKIKDYEENYTLLYNIGNNMRKFMESYLSFRYAGENDPLYLLNDFFSEVVGSQLNRASNEYSHLSWLEKGSSLLDIPEAERLAILILKGLKNNDITHYNSLCKKIDANPNIV